MEEEINQLRREFAVLWGRVEAVEDMVRGVIARIDRGVGEAVVEEMELGLMALKGSEREGYGQVRAGLQKDLQDRE